MLIEPWHWLILGLVLIILELFLTSFVSLSIGVAAIVVAAFSWLLPFSWFFWLMVWLILSVIFTIIGFKFIIGETGMIVQSPQADKLGKIRFSVPIFGADEWVCRSYQSAPLAVGDRAIVVDVIGNELLVESTKHQ
jgi:membrane protein implicated in regulation of membrane protease activity